MIFKLYLIDDDLCLLRTLLVFQVDDDLQFLLESDSSEVEETVKKYSDELFATVISRTFRFYVLKAFRPFIDIVCGLVSGWSPELNRYFQYEDESS